MPVCQAIQHAHQKGVIHRDLKPSNVLVALYDDRPVPKVIDFGVAKATGQQLTEQTLHTGFGAVVGTVEYMSPEQASFNQLDVDTRSDVYSLGVLLYELLAGSPPFSRQGAGEGRGAGDAAGDPRAGAVEAEHQAEHGGRAADAGRQPGDGAEAADGAGAGRAGLDRDEGAGEGPQPPVRDGQRLRRGRAALPGGRAGRGPPAERRGTGCGSSSGGTRGAVAAAAPLAAGARRGRRRRCWRCRSQADRDRAAAEADRATREAWTTASVSAALARGPDARRRGLGGHRLPRPDATGHRRGGRRPSRRADDYAAGGVSTEAVRAELDSIRHTVEHLARHTRLVKAIADRSRRFASELGSNPRESDMPIFDHLREELRHFGIEPVEGNADEVGPDHRRRARSATTSSACSVNGTPGRPFTRICTRRSSGPRGTTPRARGCTTGSAG